LRVDGDVEEITEGATEGAMEGTTEGAMEGITEGAMEGITEGKTVEVVVEGSEVGTAEGVFLLLLAAAAPFTIISLHKKNNIIPRTI
jgi:hypothetical protein